MSLLFWTIRRDKIPAQVCLLRDLRRSLPEIRKPISCLGAKLVPGIKREEADSRCAWSRRKWII